MYISDRKIFETSAVVFLVLGPVIATAIGIWSWIIELLLLASVVYTGRARGIKFSALLLLAGYVATILIFGFSGIKQMGLVPWSGFVLLKGWAYDLKPKTIVFWGLIAAGILGAFPVILLSLSGIQSPELHSQLVKSTIEMYKETGMMEALQEAGVSESQLTISVNEIIKYYLLLIPSLLALGGLFEFIVVYLVFGARVRITQWQLPWYAVWGAILGIASYLIGDILSLLTLKTFGMNLIVVYAAVAFFLGISLAGSFLTSSRIPRSTKLLAVAGGLLFMHFIVILLILFAVFDFVLNFRKIPDESQEV